MTLSSQQVENASMARAMHLRTPAKVVEALPSAVFRLELPNGHQIIAHVSGKMRMHYIRILPGDTVTVEINPYDPKKGRIVYRG